MHPLEPMQPLEPNDTETWAQVRELLAVAETFDVAPAISDQALIAATQGKRSVFVWRESAAGAVRKDEVERKESSDLGERSERSERSYSGAGSRVIAAVGIVGEGELDLVVKPGLRGLGIGSLALEGLLGWAERSSTSELRVWVHGEQPAARSLLERHGFAPERGLLRLVLPPERLPEALTAARGVPTGFVVTGFSAEDAHQAAEWVRVNAAAFADHPEQGRLTIADFKALTKQPWFLAEDLRLAWAEGAKPPALTGFTWVKTQGAETELYAIGVDPKYVGQGLGAGLLGETLRVMAAHHPDRITLYVDEVNTAARALYERAGFEVELSSTQWVRVAAS